MSVRIPLMMLMRKPAAGGGGGGTIDAVEVLGGAIAASATATPTITTTLRPSDRVVVIVMKSGSTGTPSVSGLGATWTNHVAGVTPFDNYMWSAGGITGGGTLTIGVGSTSGDYVVWVLRSAIDSSITLHGSGSAQSNAVDPGVTLFTSDVASATSGMFICAGGLVGGAGSLTFPTTDSTPSSGWTTDRNGTNSVCRFSSAELTAGGTVRVGVSHPTGFQSHVVLAGVFKDS